MTALCAFDPTSYDSRHICVGWLNTDSCQCIENIDCFAANRISQGHIIEVFILPDDYNPLDKSCTLLACVQDKVMGNCTLTKETYS